MQRQNEVPNNVGSDREKVLTKALLKAAEWLGVNGRELATIIGVSQATTARMRSGGYVLREDRNKEFEISAFFVRIYRSLFAIVGGDQASARDWIRRQNTALRGVPLEMMKTIGGLNEVCEYLDARRSVV